MNKAFFTDKSFNPSKANKINEKNSKKAEFDFETAIFEYGKAVITFLKNQDFSLFDPLVSDWACQLRAYWLLKLMHDHPALSDLSEEQIKALGIYRLLTESIVQEKDELGMVLNQTTNVKFHPTNWNLSNSAMHDIYGLSKQRLAEFVIKSLIEDINKSSIPHKDLLLKRFEKNVYTKFSGTSINVIEFFSGCAAILELAIEHKIPVAIELKQFSYKDNKYKLCDAHTLIYCPLKEKFINVDLNDNLDKTALVFHMYSALSFLDNLGTNFCNLNDPEKFLLKLKSMDISELILTIAATHPQFSSQAYIIEGTENKPITTLPQYQDKLTDLFKQCLNYGTQEKIGTASYYTKGGGFFKNTIPINVDHVSVDKIEHVKEEQESFALNCKNNFG